MQVLCKATEKASDVRCSVCGQGFVVYWTRTSPEARERSRGEILEALKKQHADGKTGREAHPQVGFNLPEWQGDPRFSAAALLGNAPAWATV